MDMSYGATVTKLTLSTLTQSVVTFSALEFNQMYNIKVLLHTPYPVLPVHGHGVAGGYPSMHYEHTSAFMGRNICPNFLLQGKRARNYILEVMSQSQLGDS